MTEPRHERKFFAEGLDIAEVQAVVRCHPALFRPIYAPRAINNVYYDDPRRSAYFDNVEGLRDRHKVRVRWYGELFGSVAPTLEIKVKRGLVGTKHACPLPEISINRDIGAFELAALLRGADAGPGFRPLLATVVPALVNRYRRHYYRSGDGRFRLTLDDQLLFYRRNATGFAFASPRRSSNGVILELKYGLDDDDDARAITGRLPFRLARSSKYVAGIDRTVH